MMIGVEKMSGGGGTDAVGGGGGRGSPSRRPLAKDELNKAYQQMLVVNHQRQRRDAVSGQSGDEAMLRTASPSKTTTNTSSTTSPIVVVVEDDEGHNNNKKEHQEPHANNNQHQKCDEKCVQKIRGPKKAGGPPAKKWTSALRVVAAMTRFKNMPKQANHRKGSICGSTNRVLQSASDQQQQKQRSPLVMATSPKVKALRRGISTAVASTSRRGALISQRSLQCPIGSTPRLAQQMAANRWSMAQQQQQNCSNLFDEKKRKISAGAYFGHASSSFMPNEAFPGHYTPPSGAASSYAIRQHQQCNDYDKHCQQYSQQQQQDESSRGSSFSNESTPGRNGGTAGSSTEQDPDNIDPVYLALKQATEKYGTPAGSRRGSQNVVMALDALTPSPRDLSQTSLQDSGTYSGSECCATRPPRLVAGGSTPHLHGISVGKSSAIGGANGEGNANNCLQPSTSGSRRPKLSEKMKSLSLDCAEMPEPVQSGMIRQQYKTKPMRSARGFADSSIVVQQSFDKSASPLCRTQQQALPSEAVQSATAQPQYQRRLPPVPSSVQQHHQQGVLMQKQLQPPNNNNNGSSMMHIIIHEYSSAGDCVLRPGDRVVVVDNGDPDWKHGFKLNDCLEHLLTFPSSCVAAYHMEEQPMQLLQSCNLVEQKMRLYRDQIVFAQPNGLSGEGRMLLVRNEHNKFANCPLQFLTLA